MVRAKSQQALMPLAAVVLLGCSTLVQAQPYIGASVGRVDYDQEGVSSATGFDLYGGFKFNDYLAVEGVYTDLAQVDVRFVEQTVYEYGGSAYLITESFTGKLDADSLGVAAKFILPLGERFELYARGGFHNWDAELRGLGASASDDGTDLLLGIGFSFLYGDVLSLGARYIQYELDEDEVSLFAANFEFYF